MTEKQPSLTVIGDIGVDLVMGPLDDWPSIGTETIMPQSELRAGGSGGNCALATRHLGRPCRLVALTGSDTLGRWLADQFDSITTAISTDAGATSLSVGMIHACGERTFFTTEGHLHRFTLDHVEQALPARAVPGSIALLTGVFLTPSLRTRYPQLISMLKARGFAVAIDTGWPSEGWTAALRAEVMTWLQAADHILLNETEIVHLSGTDDLESALTRLSAAAGAASTLVAKTGSKGAVAIQQGELVSADAPQVRVFDTIGAGDSFNAGYLLARLEGRSLQASLSAGCTAAAAIISRFPRAGIAPGVLASEALQVALRASV